MKLLLCFILAFCPLFSCEEIFLKRHSGKAFDPLGNVTQEQIRTIIEAGKWAPSSHNDQPWNFIICHRNLTPEAYQKAFSCFKPTQQAWAQDAPLFIMVVVRTKELYDGKFNYWAEYDTGASAISMALQATALGLMAHQVGGFDKDRARSLFKLPEECKPMAIMVIGYEAFDPNALPRERREVGKNCFLGEWGIGFE